MTSKKNENFYNMTSKKNGRNIEFGIKLIVFAHIDQYTLHYPLAPCNTYPTFSHIRTHSLKCAQLYVRFYTRLGFQ